ncbi:ABC transporter substrate-binding protein [Paenibacillus sp. sgz302251]|uniref:ABC transporter substrate-binding protein n=1 Tax=Paenibacillus sp. sgz302251 TaxID=3414493 RepID=UPI003C7C1958
MLKKIKIPFVSLLTIVILFVFMIAGCSSKQSVAPKQNEVIRIGYINLISMAPAIIAEKQNLMQKQGIKAEFYSFGNGPDLNKALTSGKVDFAYTGIPVAVNWASRGADIEVIAKVGDGKFGLLTKDNPTTSQTFDLKGKKIGFLGKGTGSDILIRGFLLPEEHLEENSVNLVEMTMTNMEQSLINNTIDAALAGEPYVTFAELRGLKVVKQLPDPAIVVLVGKSFAKEHGDLVEKFIQGHLASISYINEHPKESAEVLSKSFNVPEIKAEGKTWTPAEAMEKAMTKHQFAAKFSGDDIKFYQQIADANLRLKLIDKPFDINSIMNLTWIK